MKVILNFFNLLDSEQRLSITNVAVLVVLVKLAISPSASITEAGMLLITIGNYAHKRVTNQNNQTPEEDTLTPQVTDMQKKLEDMATKVSGLAMSAGIKKMGS